MIPAPFAGSPAISDTSKVILVPLSVSAISTSTTRWFGYRNGCDMLIERIRPEAAA